MKLKLFSLPEKGGRRRVTSYSREMGRTSVIRTRNSRRKRLQIRRVKYTCIDRKRTELGDKESGNDGLGGEGDNGRVTALSLSLSLLSSSSDHSSSENYDVLSGFEEKTCESHGFVSVIGRRREMEDAVRVEVGFMVKGGGGGDGRRDQKYDFFAVYDGHGGSRVAEACKARLHRVLVEVIAEHYSCQNGCVYWDRVMEGCFEKMDEEVNKGRLKEEMVGSTAVVAVVGRRELVVANCGDSRSVLSRGGVVVPLSRDHKPDRPDELRRVEAAGGRVINWNGHRILGVLATSRSIGDQYLKPFVICKPEVMVIDRTDTDEFLILASDGLWDVVSNEMACQVVRRCFSGHIKWATSSVADADADADADAADGNQNRATRAAAVLAELAMARGSSDNISVIVVELNNPS